MNNSGRIGWIETLRAIAMLMVVIPHFIAAFCPEIFIVWQTHSLFLKGISGKHGVAIFCVLIGYFSSRKNHSNIPTYLIRRYLQFAINIGLVLVVFSCVNSALLHLRFVVFVKHLMNAVLESLLFNCGMNPTLWCVKDMFYGSVICFVLGNYFEMEDKRKQFGIVLGIALFMFFANVWIAICILGMALRLLESIEVKGKMNLILCLLFTVAIPLLYRHDESHKTYMMQGVSCCMFMYVCMCVSSIGFLKKLPSLKVLPFLGNISFYVFLWHTPINLVLELLDLNLTLWALFGISFSTSMALALAQHWLNERWIKSFIKRVRIETVKS
jgi:peptidoglycan/LPS O-acetylase OafA/YrhL